MFPALLPAQPHILAGGPRRSAAGAGHMDMSGLEGTVLGAPNVGHRASLLRCFFMVSWALGTGAGMDVFTRKTVQRVPSVATCGAGPLRTTVGTPKWRGEGHPEGTGRAHREPPPEENRPRGGRGRGKEGSRSRTVPQLTLQNRGDMCLPCGAQDRVAVPKLPQLVQLFGGGLEC